MTQGLRLAIAVICIGSIAACSSKSMPAFSPQSAAQRSADANTMLSPNVTTIGTVVRSYSGSDVYTANGTATTYAVTETTKHTVLSGVSFNGRTGLYEVHGTLQGTDGGTYTQNWDNYSVAKPVNGDAQPTLVGWQGVDGNSSRNFSYKYVQHSGSVVETYESVPVGSTTPSYTGRETWYPNGSYAYIAQVPVAASGSTPAYTQTNKGTEHGDGSGSYEWINNLASFPSGSPPYDELETFSSDAAATIAYNFSVWYQPPTSVPPGYTYAATLSNSIPTALRYPVPLQKDTFSGHAGVVVPLWCSLPFSFPATGNEIIDKWHYVDAIGGYYQTGKTISYTVGGIQRACASEVTNTTYFDSTTGAVQATDVVTLQGWITSTTFPVGAAVPDGVMSLDEMRPHAIATQRCSIRRLAACGSLPHD